MWRGLLFSRFILYNALALALVAYAYLQGWLTFFLASDHVTAVTFAVLGSILALFVYVTLGTGARIWQTGRDLDRLKGGSIPLALDIDREALKMKLKQRVSGNADLTNKLVFLGLVGTVIGFLVAFFKVSAADTSNLEGVKGIISNLMGGMALSLLATLVGSVTHVWARMNVRLLDAGCVKLYTGIITRWERWAESEWPQPLNPETWEAATDAEMDRQYHRDLEREHG